MNEVLIGDWLDWLASGSTATSTMRQRAYLIRAFAARYDLATATPDDVQAWLALPHRKAEARKGVLATLRSFYRWAVARDYIAQDATRLSRSIHVPLGVPKPCPDFVIERALMRSTEDVRLMLLLGAFAGMRREEIASLHSRHVTERGLVFRGKGSKERRVPIDDRIAPYLTFDGWAFPSWRKPGHHFSPDYVASRLEVALGRPWTAHSLRHRAATAWYRSSRDLRAVQLLLGHTSPTTTARYVLVDEDILDAVVRGAA